MDGAPGLFALAAEEPCFVTGHDFSRAVGAAERPLGFSPFGTLFSAD